MGHHVPEGDSDARGLRPPSPDHVAVEVADLVTALRHAAETMRIVGTTIEADFPGVRQNLRQEAGAILQLVEDFSNGQ